ncbi:fluoroquinolone transport system permease protein [Salirhabdus euzebyi]|uniref:Fluoroquinolone transport system permease protein n=1 Tax=Salirhabdus euzebyi TaxID=394506 RepID=A0A841Q428_9BACI|nr:hypothetical protein [Salirhabdus euzebyi]MBB6453171.1 fluoroquinolone transport system permease protein [Salirhabdus euzebyi]
MRLLETFKMDVQFQLRHGFYYAYALVTLFYIGLLLFIPESFVQTASIMIVFTDPSVLGFFFVGGLVLLERDQSIFNTLFVTPLQVKEYIWSKVLSLTCLATITSTILFMIIHQGTFYFVPFILAVLLCSLFFTLLGIILAVRVSTVNAFLYASPIFVIIFYLPLLSFFGVYHSDLFYMLPTKSILILMEGAFTDLSLMNYVFPILICIFWIGIAYIWAFQSFYQFLKTKCFS